MQVRHERDTHRFIGDTPSGSAVLAYAPSGSGALELYSTYVPAAERGQGLGGQLVQAAVAYAREHGLRIIPTCWYVAEWIGAHPEHRDLVVASPRP
jgi:predicted GNAT family acetyltransferase